MMVNSVLDIGSGGGRSFDGVEMLSAGANLLGVFSSREVDVSDDADVLAADASRPRCIGVNLDGIAW